MSFALTGMGAIAAVGLKIARVDNFVSVPPEKQKMAFGE
jgi:hypothetical protein